MWDAVIWPCPQHLLLVRRSSYNYDIHKCIYIKAHRDINTLRPRKMAAISQTMFSNAFSWMKMFEFCLRFRWSLFLRVQLTIFHHWFRWWLGADQATSHYLNQWWLVYWRIYASLGLNELKPVMRILHQGWMVHEVMANILLCSQHMDEIYNICLIDNASILWLI